MSQNEAVRKSVERSHMYMELPASWNNFGRILHVAGSVECRDEVAEELLGTNARLPQAPDYVPSVSIHYSKLFDINLGIVSSIPTMLGSYIQP